VLNNASISAAADVDLRSARQAIIDAHSAAESAGDLDALIATFHHPRYEIVPTGEVFDGEEAVRRYHGENFAGFPDFTIDPIAIYHSDDTVVEEAWVSGTHLGTYHDLPPTGRFLRLQVCGIYVFEEDRLVCERVYYDLFTVLRGLGIAHDPESVAGKLTTLVSHPIHLGRTFGREFLRRRGSRSSAGH
jgi:predicted ester cyclase